MKRVTYKTINERSKNSNYNELPKLKDILVDLSIRNSPKVIRSLRLVGLPIEFLEYNNKKRDPEKGQGKTKEVPFPDAEKNKKITRIGHEDKTQCPWNQMGYIASKKYAIRCLEKQSDDTWLPKILCKGPKVFDEFANWETGRVEDDEKEENTSIFLGGDKAPVAKVQATANAQALGGVEYKVLFNSKDMELTEDLINLLRAVREPSADELNELRSEYNTDRKEDDSLPEWRDYFEYSFDLKRIFKFTPPVMEEALSSSEVQEASKEESEDNSGGSSVASELEEINW